MTDIITTTTDKAGRTNVYKVGCKSILENRRFEFAEKPYGCINFYFRYFKYDDKSPLDTLAKCNSHHERAVTVVMDSDGLTRAYDAEGFLLYESIDRGTKSIFQDSTIAKPASNKDDAFEKALTSAFTVGAAVAATGALVAVGLPAFVAAAATAGATTLVGVSSYHREDGTYVRAHNRTQPDGWEGNNFSAA